jgi:hypothetical protein
VFAAFVGTVGVGVWMLVSSRGEASNESVTTSSAAVIAPQAAASPGPTAGHPSVTLTAGATPAAAATESPSPSPSPALTTIDVSQLPVAKPEWTPPSPPRGGGAPPPATTSKPPALPANPY